MFSPSGRQVAGSTVDRGAALYAAIRTSEAGTFVVSWQVLAADTHPSRGAFAFSIGRESGNPYSTLVSSGQAGTTTPLGLALQTVARWVHFVGFALAFGTVAYEVVMRRGRRARRLVGTGAVLLVAAEPLSLVAQLASLSFDSDTAVAVLGSEFGRLLGLRLAAAVGLWAVIAVDSPWPVLGIGAVVAVLDGASAHAIQGLAGAGFFLTSVHVAAMGLWVGGVAAFIRAPDSRFPRYALGTFALAAVSGGLLALSHLGSLGALGSGYGAALMVKLMLVGGVLGAALVRRHRAELALLTAVVGAAALVAALPPPR